MSTKKTQPLMIPFSNPDENMLDYYDFKFDAFPNNRTIVKDTVSGYRIWMQHDPVERDTYFRKIESGEYIEMDEVVWKQNFVFTDTLKYDRYSRGRSSAKIHFKGETTGKKYEMFLTDFDDIMNTVGFNGNTITGAFTFVKRGANYGIKLVDITGDKVNE